MSSAPKPPPGGDAFGPTHPAAGPRRQSRQAPTAPKPAQRGTGFIAFLGELVRRKPAGAVFGGVVVLMLFAGIFADQLAPHDVNQVRMTDRLQPPSATCWLGTDQLGRDLFSRLMHGARISVTIGLTATTLSTGLGILIGVPSGFPRRPARHRRAALSWMRSWPFPGSPSCRWSSRACCRSS